MRAKHASGEPRNALVQGLAPTLERESMGPVFNGTRLPHGEAERNRAGSEWSRVTRGDQAAFAAIYTRYSPGICGYVRSIVQDPHEAEDLTQQVFIKLMTAHPTLTGSDLAPWLLRVARNTAIDSLRRGWRTQLCDPHRWKPGGVAPDEETRRSLEDALADLSSGQRDVLVLRDMLGLTPREAARCLGKSDGAVNMLHHRARRIVRDTLTRCHSGPCTQRGERVAG
jgi:RNA polymerase sigma-70 factor, ECF subfamily